MDFIFQDITKIEKGLIFHQVNIDGVMGAGLAKALADKFPDLEKEYQSFVNVYRGRRNELMGQYQIVPVIGTKVYVVNIFGQTIIPNGRTRKQTQYDAVDLAFATFVQNEQYKYADLKKYFPYQMGCGLGGGNWRIYRTIIETYFPDAIICEKPSSTLQYHL